jgi:Reverse transcriptase (RNA-dependent DNA polymerase)
VANLATGSKEGIISGEQIGFMPKLGCEMHVLSAIETVKMNASQGHYTAITFIDFSSAYDNVNLELLWEMLREAGVAENVITVLEDWYATRQYQVRAGDEKPGDVQDPFTADKGLHQGGPLSPLLWNIYMDPLLRRFKKETEGVVINGSQDQGELESAASFRSTSQAYADDIGVTTSAPSREGLRQKISLALGILQEWETDFQAEVNTKEGKTEIMAFAPHLDEEETKTLRSPAAGESPLGLLPPVPMGEHRKVNFVTSYRYLGCPLNQQLNFEAFVAKKVKSLEFQYNTLFKYNKALDKLSYRAKLQIANTLCISVVIYLINIVPMGADTLLQIDTICRKIARAVYSYPEGICTKPMDLETPFVPMLAMTAMQTYRQYQAVQHTIMEDFPAKRLLAFQQEFYHRPGTYAYDTEERLSALLYNKELREKVWTITNNEQIGPEARLIRHNIAASFLYTNYRSLEAFNEAPATKKALVEEIAKNARKPRMFDANEHIEDLYMGRLPVGAIPEDARVWSAWCPSLSLIGPRCASLLQQCTIPGLSPGVLVTRLGRDALAYYPWNQRRLVTKTGPKDPSVPLFSKQRPDRCPLCKMEGDENKESPHHYFFKCPHPQMVRHRKELKASLRNFLAEWLESLYQGTRLSNMLDEGKQELTNMLAAVQRVTTALKSDANDIQNWVIYRMLLALPFPSFLAAAEEGIAIDLGTIFDYARIMPRYTSKPANMLMRWATKWIKTFAETRLRLLPRGHYDHPFGQGVVQAEDVEQIEAGIAQVALA